MKLEELLKEYDVLLLKPDGTVYSDTGQQLLRVSPTVYTTLASKGSSTVNIGGVSTNVTPLKDNSLKLTQHIDFTKIVEDYSNIEVDIKTGEIKTLTETKVGFLPEHLLNALRDSDSNKFNIGNRTLYVSKDSTGKQLFISKTDTVITSIEDYIKFGLENGVSNITLTPDGSRYRIGNTTHSFPNVMSDKDLREMISRYDTSMLNTLDKLAIDSRTRLYSNYNISINMHCIKDTRHTVIIDFIANKERSVEDFFDMEWLKFIKSRNKSESGGLVILTEKQALPDIIPLFINNITTTDDIVMTYDKRVSGITAQLLEYSKAVPIGELSNINTDVVILDFSIAVSNWDVVFDMIDNGSVVALTVNDSDLYMTLNMVLETFVKQYHFRKFIDTLLGINTIGIIYQGGTTEFEVKYDYIYNNKQFQILLGSKTYTKIDLKNKKYKHFFLSIGGIHKSIEDVLRDILTHANDIGAHDISLSAGAPPAFRKGKDLVYDFMEEKLQPYMTESIFLEIVQDLKLQEKFRQSPGQGLPVSYSVPGVGRYRVNVYMQRGSVALSLRKIPSEIPTMDWCGLPKEVQEVIKMAKTGLILVTGPTGSGKSTTLASIIDHYNDTRPHKIITNEDPIEYLHNKKKALIEQIEIGQDSDSYTSTLRSNMRNNPDILLIGEIRDADVLGISLNAAVTGHLVLATMHTSGAIETVERILDMTPVDARENTKSLLSQNLICTITQQLLPKVGGGMVPAHEVMILNPAVKSAISDGRPQALGGIRSQLSANRASGMRDMDYSVAQHVIDGKVALHDAETYAHSIDALKRYVEIGKTKK